MASGSYGERAFYSAAFSGFGPAQRQRHHLVRGRPADKRADVAELSGYSLHIRQTFWRSGEQRAGA